MLAGLAKLIDDATRAYDGYDYARALERTESWFWTFTDDHVELVKARAYGEQGPEAAESAQHALRLALSAVLRMFAPFLPFVTEEVWSWWQDGSVHRQAWPTTGELGEAAAAGDPLVAAVASDVVAEIRKAKTEAKRSLRADVARLRVVDTPERIAALRGCLGDVSAAGRVAEAELAEGDAPSVQVELAPEPAEA
jgi:valyl-tRNA synthetase